MIPSLPCDMCSGRWASRVRISGKTLARSAVALAFARTELGLGSDREVTAVRG